MEDLCLAFVENSVVNMHCDFRTQKSSKETSYFCYKLYDSSGNSGPFVWRPIGVKFLSGFLIIKAFFFVNLVSKHASKMNVQEFAS